MLMSSTALWRIVALTAVAGMAASGAGEVRDRRDIASGAVIYRHGYCDQPYVVVCKDGAWLCVFTTGAGHEGDVRQYIAATRSTDAGRTWTEPVPIEPPGDVEASWAMPLIVPSGRVYVFYVYNGDRVRTLAGKGIRADMLGWYCLRYSDDGGRTWSQRHRIPIRTTACDRSNDWQGQVQILWGIGKPVVFDGTAMFALTKLGRYMLDDGEGWFVRSDNILTESDPERIRWELLPDGEQGVRNAAFGSIQEEHNIVPLGPEDLFCMYRTTMGWPASSYSHDGGRTWTEPQPATYTPGGQTFKHPRACPRIWKTTAGRYLFWFHNNGGKTFDDRNPAWVSGGIERNGDIHWSQPEILLYDADPKTRISYPDLIEQDGRTFITETQKTIARVHEIDPNLLAGLWSQGKAGIVARRGLVAEVTGLDIGRQRLRLPRAIGQAEGPGFTIEVVARFDDLSQGQVILDSRSDDGRGVCVGTTERQTIEVVLSDGKSSTSWDCDTGLLQPRRSSHVVITYDAGPRILVFVVDGTLCDGGSQRQFGWTRGPADICDFAGTSEVSIAPSLRGRLGLVRLYNRPLRTSEAIGNFRASR